MVDPRSGPGAVNLSKKQIARSAASALAFGQLISGIVGGDNVLAPSHAFMQLNSAISGTEFTLVAV